MTERQLYVNEVKEFVMFDDKLNDPQRIEILTVLDEYIDKKEHINN